MRPPQNVEAGEKAPNHMRPEPGRYAPSNAAGYQPCQFTYVWMLLALSRLSKTYALWNLSLDSIALHSVRAILWLKNVFRRQNKS